MPLTLWDAIDFVCYIGMIGLRSEDSGREVEVTGSSELGFEISEAGVFLIADCFRWRVLGIFSSC